MKDELDLVGKLQKGEKEAGEFAMRCISPDDAKYRKASKKLAGYLSADAEWKACARVQKVLLETRVEFGQAKQENLDEVIAALEKIDTLNISLIEDNVTKHDQLAVIEEIGRYVSAETKALLHPGTTSYDILDTARSHLYKNAWLNMIKPEVEETINKLCNLAEKCIKADEESMEKEGRMRFLQVGRTHLQNTSPVLFGATLAGYAARLAERLEKTDKAFKGLKGKISGISGTGASIDMVIGEGKSEDFEIATLKKLGLEPDWTATQIVQKERLTDCGHYLTTLMHVLGDFSNDMRMLYSSAINEVTSRDNKERLGGSSADATKNNPINYENMCGKVAVVESGMGILYKMIQSDFQRDLRGSVMARYQPAAMMVETCESFNRISKALDQLSINEDKMSINLMPVRKNPSEALVAILRGEGWTHTKYGVGHDFVKAMGKLAQKTGKPLMEVCIEDEEFKDMYQRLPENKKDILNGELEKYTGSAASKAQSNLAYARMVTDYRGQ